MSDDRIRNAGISASVRGLWLPPSSVIHKERPVRICRVIVNGETGEICGHPFFATEGLPAEERHLRECAARHQGAIRAFRKKQHPDIMEPWDAELFAWVREHGEEILEGRKRLGGGVA